MVVFFALVLTDALPRGHINADIQLGGDGVADGSDGLLGGVLGGVGKSGGRSSQRITWWRCTRMILIIASHAV